MQSDLGDSPWSVNNKEYLWRYKAFLLFYNMLLTNVRLYKDVHSLYNASQVLTKCCKKSLHPVTLTYANTRASQNSANDETRLDAVRFAMSRARSVWCCLASHLAFCPSDMAWPSPTIVRQSMLRRSVTKFSLQTQWSPHVLDTVIKTSFGRLPP